MGSRRLRRKSRFYYAGRVDRATESRILLIFRNDDICSNTNLMRLREMYEVIKQEHPAVRIISGVTLFSSGGTKGSIYDDIPFKDKPTNWFYGVDSFIKDISRVPGEIASHGLLHVDHSKISRDAQEMSILTSCNYLGTNLFIPPFNKFNADTVRICLNNNITIFNSKKWKSIEFEPFNTDHEYWYFHSWRYDKDTLRKAISVNSGNVGQLQADACISS